MMLAGLFAGCAASQASYVNPGMSRQEVIKSLGPPLTVVAKDEIGVEYLYYRVPSLEKPEQGEGEPVDLVVPIHDGTVLSPGHPLGPH